MADDIVSELRIVAESTAVSVADWSDLMRDAADEIELLRGALNGTQELLARTYTLAVGHGPDLDVFGDWEDAISAYEEADRG